MANDWKKCFLSFSKRFFSLPSIQALVTQIFPLHLYMHPRHSAEQIGRAQ